MCHKRGIKARIYDDKLSSHLSGVSGIVVVPIEKVASPGFLLFVRNLQAKKALARFVVDEAHSVLTQGHFREAMQDIKELRSRTNTRDVPITLFTATLPPSWESHMAHGCGLKTDKTAIFRDPVDWTTTCSFSHIVSYLVHLRSTRFLKPSDHLSPVDVLLANCF